MDKSQLLALFDQDQRREVEYPDMRREVAPPVVRHVATSGTGEGMIAHSQLSEVNADQVIREQVAYFEGLGQDFEWKVYDYDHPPDLKQRLEQHGFVIEEAEALVILDLEAAPKMLLRPVRHDVRRILDPEALVHVQSVEEQVWDEEFPWVIPYLGNALRHYPEQMSVYVAYVDGQPASAAWIYFPQNSQFASLWGGATVKRFRARGLYTALLAVRLQEAKARQVRYLTVDASPMSRPILEKFGFEMLAYTFPCKWRVRAQERKGAA